VPQPAVARSSAAARRTSSGCVREQFAAAIVRSVAASSKSHIAFLHIGSENRIIKKNMMVVLPAERRAAAAAWRKAKAANKELAKFQRRVNEGRAVVPISIV